MKARYDVLIADAVEAKNDSRHLDSVETAFFKRELEYVKSRTYDVKYRNLKAIELIPVSTDAPAGADYIIWYSYAKAGMAKIVSDYANDFPRVDVYATEEQSKIYTLGDSYGYSIKEIRRAAMAGNNLDTRRANTARRAMDELMDKLAWFGDDDFSIQGFINYPGITEYTVPNGAAASKTWASKTSDEINADLVGIMDAVSVPTKGREQVDTILLPRTQFNLLKNTRMSTASDKTIFEFFTSNNPGVTLEVLDELAGQGASATDRYMAYVKDAEHLTQEMPLPFTQSDPEKKGLTWVIPCEAEHAGVIVYYPQSVAFGDGI